MNSVVVDASVLLQVVRNEPGFERVLPKLYSGCISTVNYAETVDKLFRGGMPPSAAISAIDPLCRDLRPFTVDHAQAVAEIREAVGKASFSLADLACLATAKVEGASVLTNDRAWVAHDLGVKVELARPTASKRQS